MEVIVVAAVLQCLLAHIETRGVGHAAPAQAAVLLEEGRQVHVGGQLGLAQVQVKGPVPEHRPVVGIVVLQQFHIQTAVGEHLCHLPGSLEPDGVVLIHQQLHGLANHIGLGQSLLEHLGVVAHLPGQGLVVEAGIGGRRQRHRISEAVVAAGQEPGAVDGIAQRHPDLGLGEDLALDVAADVEEDARLRIPQLIIAAVGGVAGGTGIGGGDTQGAEFELVPDLGLVLARHQLHGPGRQRYPVVGGFGLIVCAMVALMRYVRRGALYIFGGGFIAFGGFMLLVEFLLDITFGIPFIAWSVYPLIAFVLLGGGLIYLAIN